MINGKQYVLLQHIFSSALFRSVRLLFAFLIVIALINQLNNHESVKLPLFFLLWFSIIEIFFHYHVGRYHPTVSIAKKTNELTDCATAQLLSVYLFCSNSQQVVQKLAKYQQIIFIMMKLGISLEEIPQVELDNMQTLQYAIELVKTVHGSFVTSMDFFCSYLLLSEEQTKLLFNHKVKKEELIQILSWARFTFPQEETPNPTRVQFSGEGLGETLINGWTLETKKYTVDFTYSTVLTKPFLTGREELYKLLLEALSKTQDNNVLLVGEPGVGKENLVIKLADDSYYGKLSPYLNHKKILQLMVGPLIAGAENRNELELRLQAVVEEIAHAHNVILYIADFENLMGSSSFNLDVSGALLPYLKSGLLPIIASMSKGNYKTFLEQNPIKEVFTIMQVDEPDKEVAMQMLMAKATIIEETNGVVLTYNAIAKAAQLADRYEADAVLPGSAVTLLNDSANAVSLSEKGQSFGKTSRKIVTDADIEAQLTRRTHINLGSPSGQEKELLLHLEDKLHERIVDQVQAIRVISEAMRRLRSGLTSANRPISFLFLGPTGVGKSETAKALAEIYYGGEDKMIRLDMSEYSDEDGEKRLLGSPPGEGNERGELTDKVHDHPFSLIMLDEFEKASTKILNLFLQVLEDGRLTDNKGRTVSFMNCIIIATSNAGAEFIREKIVSGQTIDKSFQQQLLEYLQQNQLFKPELLNRFDDVVTFMPLGNSELTAIAQLLLQKISKQLAEQDITLSFDSLVMQKIIHEGADAQFGARPLRRYIQDTIEDIIAKKELEDEIKRGDTVMISVDGSNALTTTISHSG